MDKRFIFGLVFGVLFVRLAESGSETWQWKYDGAVCYNQNENATLTWRVTLNSGETLSNSVGNVEIWQVIVDGGGTTRMYSRAAGGVTPAFNTRNMSVTVNSISSGPPPVYDVIFTLSNVSHDIDGFGTKKIQCRVTASSFDGGQSPADTLLKVQVPIESYNITPSSATVNEYGPLNLTCSVTGGTPTPTIKWINQSSGAVVAQGRSSFIVANVTRDMAGDYVCKVTDGCGNNYTKTATVVVQYKPENTKLTSNVSSSVCKNDYISVTCSASASPPVSSYTFYNNSNVLVTQPNLTYVFKTIEGGDLNLTCDATNVAGVGVSPIVPVTVKVPAHNIMSASSVKVNESDSVNLAATCTAEGTPTPTITWRNPQGNVSLSSLSNVNRAMAGNYTCVITDGCGRVNERTVLLDVQYIHFINGNKCSNSNFDITVASNPPGIRNISCEGQTDNKTPTSSSGNSIIYTMTKPSDSTNITCVATNIAGISDSATYTVYSRGSGIAVYGTFTIDNLSCPPSDQVQEQIEKLVNESFGSCGSSANITYECGSLIVNVAMKLSANISDPFVDFKEALIQNSAQYGFVINPSSVKTKQGGTVEPSPTTPYVATSSATPPTDDGLSDVTIALIVVGVVIFLLILFGVIYLICRKKKKQEKKNDSNLEMAGRDNAVLVEGSPYAEVGPTARGNGLTSEGAYSEVVPNRSHDGAMADNPPDYATVDKTKKSKANGKEEEAVQRVPDVTYAQVDKSMKLPKIEEPTYAEVDRSKKSKKKKPGELLYADLSDFTDGSKPKNGGGLEFGSGQEAKKPDKYEETEYAEISHFLKGGDPEQKETNQPIAQSLIFPPGPPILEIKNSDVKDTNMRLKWTAPLTTGNSLIIDYKIEVGSAVVLEKIASNSIVIPELTPSTKYVVNVYARNDAGYGNAATKTVTTREPGNPLGNYNAAYSNAAYEIDNKANDEPDRVQTPSSASSGRDTALTTVSIK